MKRFYHTSPALSTPHRRSLGHPHPPHLPLSYGDFRGLENENSYTLKIVKGYRELRSNDDHTHYGNTVMPNTPLHFQTISALAASIQSRQVSPVEVTQALLERIAQLDRRYKSYATVMADHALETAKVAEQEIHAGTYRGPLHGVPVAVKDLCYTKGVRTMGGTKVLADHVPPFDATVVARLHAAGAILLGKLNLTEGAMGGYNPDFDIPVNPWHAERWSGA